MPAKLFSREMEGPLCCRKKNQERFADRFFRRQMMLTGSKAKIRASGKKSLVAVRRISAKMPDLRPICRFPGSQNRQGR